MKKVKVIKDKVLDIKWKECALCGTHNLEDNKQCHHCGNKFKT